MQSETVQTLKQVVDTLHKVTQCRDRIGDHYKLDKLISQLTSMAEGISSQITPQLPSPETITQEYSQTPQIRNRP